MYSKEAFWCTEKNDVDPDPFVLQKSKSLFDQLISPLLHPRTVWGSLSELTIWR